MVVFFALFLILNSLSCVKNEDVSKFHFGSDERFGDLDNIYTHDKKTNVVDIYTNHPNIKDVESSYYDRNSSPFKTNKYPEKFGNKINPEIDRKDTLNFGNPNNFFLSSKNDDNIQSESNKNLYNYNKNNDFYVKKIENKDLYIYNKNTDNIYEESVEDVPSFVTKNHGENIQKSDRNKYIFLQSQMVIPDEENVGSFYTADDRFEGYERRPHFLTQNNEKDLEQSGDRNGYTYVQKIPFKKSESTTAFPELESENSHKYEELDLFPDSTHKKGKVKIKNTKTRINNLLKQYLAQLIIEKYSHTDTPSLDAPKNDADRKYSSNADDHSNNLDLSDSHSDHQGFNRHKIPKNDQESKFLTSDVLWSLKNKTLTKIKKLFSIFTVIKFNNTECNATNWAGTWQGVCYTSTECTQMNGTALGNCASGYGVCCVFRGSCGDSSSRNCSYFKSPNYPDYYPSNGDVITPTTTTLAPNNGPTPDPRFHWYYYRKSSDVSLDDLIMGRQNSETLSCTFNVYKTNPNVRQMRIDFIDLELANPTNGICQNERLIITGQNPNDQIPVICGYNTGQHVYVDVSQLNGPLQIMVLSATGARKRFKLKICQYENSCSNNPQNNCLQYYTGVTGVIQSFNYDQATMLNRSSPGYFNNLNYAICIRREAGYCSITYSNVRNGRTYPFQLVNRLPNGQLTIPPGQAGVDILNCPDDYIVIDGVRLCGERFNDGSTGVGFTMNAPVTDTSAGPIVVPVRTDNAFTGLGFKLYYTQNPCSNP